MPTWRRLQIALASVIGLAVCAGAMSAWAADRRVTALTADADRLREAQQALSHEREQAKATELSALDRRHTALRARVVPGVEELRASAEAARRAIDPKAPDHDRLRAFGDALDALETRVALLERIGQLDYRGADLNAWAADQRRKGDVTAAAKAAGTRARLMVTDDAVTTYEKALDQLHQTLAQGASARPGGPGVAVAGATDGSSCLPGEPGCGLDGKRIF
jgi:hypothetical protein